METWLKKWEPDNPDFWNATSSKVAWCGNSCAQWAQRRGPLIVLNVP